MRCRLSVYLIFISSVLFKSIPFFFRINAYCCDLILWSPAARIFVIIQSYDVIIVINNNSIFFVQTIKVVPKHSVEFSVIHRPRTITRTVIGTVGTLSGSPSTSSTSPTRHSSPWGRGSSGREVLEAIRRVMWRCTWFLMASRMSTARTKAATLRPASRQQTSRTLWAV